MAFVERDLCTISEPLHLGLRARLFRRLGPHWGACLYIQVLPMRILLDARRSESWRVTKQRSTRTENPLMHSSEYQLETISIPVLNVCVSSRGHNDMLALSCCSNSCCFRRFRTIWSLDACIWCARDVRRKHIYTKTSLKSATIVMSPSIVSCVVKFALLTTRPCVHFGIFYEFGREEMGNDIHVYVQTCQKC